MSTTPLAVARNSNGTDGARNLPAKYIDGLVHLKSTGALTASVILTSASGSRSVAHVEEFSGAGEKSVVLPGAAFAYDTIEVEVSDYSSGQLDSELVQFPR